MSTESGPEANVPTLVHEPATAAAAPAERFDLAKAPIPSFSELQQARGVVFRKREHVDALERVVDALPSNGEEGRRKGLGLWMLGKATQAVDQLARYESDEVASFTRAHALLSLSRADEAAPIFERLSSAYPDAARPRGGLIEARLEVDLEAGDEEAARANLERALAAAPRSFHESAEGAYLNGRAAELARDWEAALDHYQAAHAADPTHRAALFRGAWLAERGGLDELALQWYRALVQLLPIDKAVLYNLGVLYEDLGRDQEAAACYDTIARSFPLDRRARLYLEDAREGMDMYYDEDLERKEDRLNQILRTPITDFELSVRARNCLNKMNIVTLGDLVRLTEPELLSYKNFGETSLNEIKEILSAKNLRLGMAHHEAVASIEAAARPRATGENADVLNRPISDLDLSIRARRTVENLGCLSIGDVIQHTEDELLSMPNFGVTSLQELKRKLSELGLKLSDKKK
jgi:DNA-directed RNA polymerase subunit alpha